MPYYFHAFQLKDLLSLRGFYLYIYGFFYYYFFFYFLHLHSRLSAFLLPSNCRFANTFISMLGVGDPSILRVSYRKLAAGLGYSSFSVCNGLSHWSCCWSCHLPRSCSWVSYSGISLWKICYIINWYVRNYPKRSELSSAHKNVRKRVSGLKIFFVFFSLIFYRK